MDSVPGPSSRRLSSLLWQALRITDPLRWLALRQKMDFILQARCGRSLRVTHRAELLVHGPSAHVSIGANVIIDGTLECYERGRLIIGDHVFVGRSRIYAAHSVRVGSYVLVSDGVCVMDSDLHPIDFRRRRELAAKIETRSFPDVYTEVAAAPVEIADDVWIGYGAAILKGVQLGRGAIVGAGSVVTSDVPPWTIVAGIPARPVGPVPHADVSEVETRAS